MNRDDLLPEGSLLGHYEIQEKLGAGGMGVVYLARDLRLGRRVALKLLHSDLAADAERLSRFQREARIVAALKHPNIVTLYSIENVDDTIFLTMDWIAGRTLAEEIQAAKDGRLSVERFLSLAEPMAAALAAAHRQEVVHRDFKPSNVMLDEQGTPTILDFGIARLGVRDPSNEVDENAPLDRRGINADTSATDSTAIVGSEEESDSELTRPGAILGTLRYMSPEQSCGRPAGPPSDVFSLGAVYFEMLTGRAPFQGRTLQSLWESMENDDPDPSDHRADLPSGLAEVIRRCLVKLPEGRYQDAGEVAAALRAWISANSSRESAEIRAPLAAVHNLPFLALREGLKGREEILRRLDEGTAKRRAITGLGGVGKTRLVAEYAWRSLRQYRFTFWIFAESVAQLRADLAALAGPSLLDLRETEDEDAAVEAVLARLQESEDWLMVFDSVDDEDTALYVRSLLPRLTRGRLVMTSRLSHWGDGGDEIETHVLDCLDEDAAIEMLLARCAGDVETARGLARELGCLPLALEQAAAYMSRRRQSIEEYRADWEQDRRRVLAWHKKGATTYPASVAVTWSRSFDQLEPGSQALLRLISFLAPEPIPAAWVRSCEDLLRRAAASLGGDAEELDDLDFREILADLATFSFISWDGERFRAHRLVQEVTRTRIDEESVEKWLIWTLTALSKYLPEDSADVSAWPIWDPLRAHIERVLTHAGRAADPEPASELMGAYGLLLLGKALYEESETWLRRSLAITESRGASGERLHQARHRFVSLLFQTERFEEAAQTQRSIVDETLRIHGEDHPTVAAAFTDLAGTLYSLGHLEEAESVIRRALSVEEKHRPEHPDFAVALNTLGQLLQAMERYDEAEPFMRRALEIVRRALGEDHPAYAIRLNNLALLLKATDRLEEALPLLHRAREILEATVGEEHPWTIKIVGNVERAESEGTESPGR